MRRSVGALIASSLIAVTLAVGQQPNSPQAALLVNSTIGPPLPITAFVPPSTSATVQISGTPGAPFALFGSATGLVSAGTATFAGGIVDLPLSPPPLVMFDGFQNPVYQIGPAGDLIVTFAVPPTGIPPLGVLLGPAAGLQTVVADATVPGGLRASAATQVILSQAPVTVPLPLGLNTTTTVNLGALGVVVPFYGVNYAAMNVDSNGYITFGAPIPSQLGNSPLAFNSGPPTIAGMWTPLAPNVAGTMSYTAGTTPAGVPFARVNWAGIPNSVLGPPPTFTFAVTIHANGLITIDHTLMTAPSAFEVSVGITPGGNLSAVPTKNFAAIVAGGGLIGAVNEAFHGYHGLLTMPYYNGPVNNPYNLAGLTMNFQPIGAGALPGASNRYFMY